MRMYKIEEAAQATGLTKRTIRYYEEIGLLFPPERSEGGFRLYTEAHIERLKRIVNARDVLGFSLNDLQEFIAISEEFTSRRDAIGQLENKEEKLESIRELERVVEQQRDLVDRKLERLKEYRDQFDRLLERVRDAKHTFSKE